MIKKVSEAVGHKLGKLDAQIKNCNANIQILQREANDLLRKAHELAVSAGVNPEQATICTEEEQVVNGKQLEFCGVYSRADNSPVEEPEATTDNESTQT